MNDLALTRTLNNINWHVVRPIFVIGGIFLGIFIVYLLMYGLMNIVWHFQDHPIKAEDWDYLTEERLKANCRRNYEEIKRCLLAVKKEMKKNMKENKKK